MAVVNIKTTKISTDDTNTVKSAHSGRPLVNLNGTVEAADGDSIASTYRVIRVGSNFVPTRLELAWDSLGGSAKANVGLYQVAANGGAVVDVDAFASDVSLSPAGTWTSELEQADAADIAKIGKPLWERIGLSADPGLAYDIVVTLTGESGAAGTISAQLTGYTL